MSEVIWMIRAGQGGRLFEEFARGYVALGWEEMGDLGRAPFTEDEIKELFASTYPKEKGEKAIASASMIHQFRSVLAMNDKVMTYNPQTREYLIGTIESGYIFRPGEITDRSHLRAVKWEGTVAREDLSAVAREELRSNISLFKVDEAVSGEILAILAGEPILTPEEIIRLQVKKAERLQKRKNRGWVAIGFGVFIMALGIFLYVYADGQIYSINKHVDEGEVVEGVTIMFWFGKEISEASSSEIDDALDFLTWIKNAGLGAAILGFIVIVLGIIRIIFSTSAKLRRII